MADLLSSLGTSSTAATAADTGGGFTGVTDTGAGFTGFSGDAAAGLGSSGGSSGGLGGILGGVLNSSGSSGGTSGASGTGGTNIGQYIQLLSLVSKLLGGGQGQPAPQVAPPPVQHIPQAPTGTIQLQPGVTPTPALMPSQQALMQRLLLGQGTLGG